MLLPEMPFAREGVEMRVFLFESELPLEGPNLPVEALFAFGGEAVAFALMLAFSPRFNGLGWSAIFFFAIGSRAHKD